MLEALWNDTSERFLNHLEKSHFPVLKMCTYQNVFTEETLISETNLYNGGNNSKCPFAKYSLRSMNFSKQPLSYSPVQCQLYLGYTQTRCLSFLQGSLLGCIFQQLLVTIGDFDFFFFTSTVAEGPSHPHPVTLWTALLCFSEVGLHVSNNSGKLWGRQVDGSKFLRVSPGVR